MANKRWSFLHPFLPLSPPRSRVGYLRRARGTRRDNRNSKHAAFQLDMVVPTSAIGPLALHIKVKINSSKRRFRFKERVPGELPNIQKHICINLGALNPKGKGYCCGQRKADFLMFPWKLTVTLQSDKRGKQYAHAPLLEFRFFFVRGNVMFHCCSSAHRVDDAAHKLTAKNIAIMQTRDLGMPNVQERADGALRCL